MKRPPASPSARRRILRLLAGIALAPFLLLGLWVLNIPQRGLARLESEEPVYLPQAPEWWGREGESLHLRVVSANVECWFCGGAGVPPWEARSALTAEFLESESPDLIGLQEVITKSDLDDVVRPGEEWSYVMPKAMDFEYADAVLLYRRDRFELLESGAVWLGKVPRLPFTASWDIGWPRYINWALLREATSGLCFVFANTHFDPRLSNKDASAVLFRDELEELAQRGPVVVTGDFNTCSTAERFELVRGRSYSDSLALASTEAITMPTDWSLYRIGVELKDHILIAASDAQVSRWVLDVGASFRSDHPYIVADIELETGR